MKPLLKKGKGGTSGNHVIILKFTAVFTLISIPGTRYIFEKVKNKMSSDRLRVKISLAENIL